MFNFFRRPAAEPPRPTKKRGAIKRTPPLSLDEQFAPIPQAEAREGSDDRSWTLWDDSAAADRGKADGKAP